KGEKEHPGSHDDPTSHDGSWGARERLRRVATGRNSLARRFVTHSRYTSSLHGCSVAAMKKRAAGPDPRERFGFAVKVRREELGLTQEELADRAGIHRTYLSDIERGFRNPSLLNIERLAAALALL